MLRFRPDHLITWLDYSLASVSRHNRSCLDLSRRSSSNLGRMCLLMQIWPVAFDGCHGTLSSVETHLGQWHVAEQRGGPGRGPDQVFLLRAVCTVIPHRAPSQLAPRLIELQGLIKPHYRAFILAPICG